MLFKIVAALNFTFASNVFVMRILYPQKKHLFFYFCLASALQTNAQTSNESDISDAFRTIEASNIPEPTLTINEDPRIQQLLDIKTEMDKNGALSDTYKIQLFNGNNKDAQKVLQKAEKLFPQWETELKWETPEFKVWIGNYRSKLERDRALREIKKEFLGAFSPQLKNK